MKLTRTRAAYETIQQSLSSEKRDQFIESCLAQYLAVVLYSEMEERVSEIISAHLKKFTGSKIGQFLTSNMEGIIKRTPKSNIAKLVGSLNEDFQTKFNAQISEREVTLYTNVIQARHNIGHKQGSAIDLAEISLALDAADGILVALDACLTD